jgi:hypothetical protein
MYQSIYGHSIETPTFSEETQLTRLNQPKRPKKKNNRSKNNDKGKKTKSTLGDFFDISKAEKKLKSDFGKCIYGIQCAKKDNGCNYSH